MGAFFANYNDILAINDLPERLRIENSSKKLINDRGSKIMFNV